MKSLYFVRAAGAVALMTSLPGIAYAQAWVPGSEIVGQPVTVTTNGVSNTVYLDPGGSARIMTPGGNTVAGTWSAANGQLCLSTGAAQECFPYASAFQAGQPLTLTSSCGSSSTWLASSTNSAPPPAGASERGK
jgi:hypothetical protein